MARLLFPCFRLLILRVVIKVVILVYSILFQCFVLCILIHVLMFVDFSLYALATHLLCITKLVLVSSL